VPQFEFYAEGVTRSSFKLRHYSIGQLLDLLTR